MNGLIVTCALHRVKCNSKRNLRTAKAKLKKQIQALCACVGVHTPTAHMRDLGASLSV